MYRLEPDFFEIETELKEIKELVKTMFNASSPKEFLEAQEELKRYV